MLPFRLQIKLFLANPNAVDLSAISALYQRWIQDKTLEGQLIDVADYRHVFQGPSVVLIAFDSDYAIENRDGRLGLLYTRKRQTDLDFRSQLRTSLHLALTAAHLIESEPSFNPHPRFRADEIEIRFADRLQLPNTSESYDQVKEDLRIALTELYASDSVEIERVEQDPRYLLTVVARSEAAFRISELIQYLQAAH